MNGIAQIYAADADRPVIQIPGRQDIQFLFRMGVGVQIAGQPGKQAHPVNILLGQRGGVQPDSDFADAIHAGDGFNMADAVFVCLIQDIVCLDFFRQALHGNSFHLGDQFTHVFRFLRRVGFIDNRLKLRFAHARFDPCQFLSQRGILLFLFPGGGNGRGQGVKNVSRQPFFRSGL